MRQSVRKLIRLVVIALSIIIGLNGLFESKIIVLAETSLTEPENVCPLSDDQYNISLVSTEFKGQIDNPVLIRLNLSPYPPPAGFFYASVADFLQGPEGPKPEILPGDLEISVRCYTPGSYRLRIRVNLIAKSSCGGAKASILKEQEVVLKIIGQERKKTNPTPAQDQSQVQGSPSF
jgi:hypothetical protein